MAELIVALDFSSEDEALRLVKALGNSVVYYKVGLELFSRAGVKVIEKLSGMGKKVFLDLKFFDIPNTVVSAARVAIEAGVWMYNVHALGGRDFLRRVAEHNREYAEKIGMTPPLLIGVTVLTSMNERDLQSVGIYGGVDEQVSKLALLAKECGLDGVVCSAKEVKKIKEELGEDFLTVTPGIRPLWASVNDQKRVVTPEDAVKLGTDFIVVGRPITRAENPERAARAILEEIG